MAQSFIPDLGLVVGRNVAELREARGWSQVELVARLNADGGTWSSASVSLLETKGARGERLSDLATLCSVLQVPLERLLDGFDGLVETQSGVDRSLRWVVSSLFCTSPRGT